MLFAALLILAAKIAGAAPPRTGPFRLACAYFSATDLESASQCAAKIGDGFAIAPVVLRQLHYDHGLATISIARQAWYYRRRDGRMIEMLTYDNGPDTFSQGLARGRIDGRLVYVDRRLRVRIRTRYTLGAPFQHGRADVCTGCVETPIDGGEHTIMTGGHWAVIDRRGHEIAPR